MNLFVLNYEINIIISLWCAEWYEYTNL